MDEEWNLENEKGITMSFTAFSNSSLSERLSTLTKNN